MEIQEYQRLARRTQSDSMNGFDKEQHALFGMCSEVGEIHSLFQHLYQGEALDSTDLAEEIGDLMWFVSELADVYKIVLSDVLESNIAKLKKRYPDGFDPERSKHRHDGEGSGTNNG